MKEISYLTDEFVKFDYFHSSFLFAICKKIYLQMVLLILGCFTICWLPYFVVACSQIYRIIERSSAVAYMAAFTLAMSNSAMNPVIYAWKNSNFRQAFINLLKCKSPDTLEPSQSMRSNLHRKSSSAQHQDGISGAFPNYSTPPFHQRKIEPSINAMGITFEEDEDKISIQETTTKANVVNTNANIMSNPICQHHHHPPHPHPPVTIKIESDVQNNSIVISTTTLPDFHNENNIGSGGIDNNDDEIDYKKFRTGGNLIVNKLMENYGINETIEDENAKNINNNNGGNLRIKSKSTNSIAVMKSANKSNSNSSIYDYTHSKYRINDSNLDGKSTLDSRSNLFPSFNFGRKFLSRSFNNSTNTAVPSICKFNSNNNNSYRKSAELNFQA